MTGRPWGRLLLALAFLTFPAGLLVFQLADMDRLARTVWEDEVVERSGSRLLDEQRNSQVMVQVRGVIDRFTQGLAGTLAGRPDPAEMREAARRQAREARRWLPPHDLALVEVEGNRARILFRQASRRFFPTPGLLRAFARWGATGRVAPADLATRLSRAMNMLHSLSDFMHSWWRGEFRYFAMGTTSAAGIWDVLPTGTAGRVVVMVCFLDLTFLADDLGPRLAVKTWKDPACGIAFLPRDPARPVIVSSLVRRAGPVLGRLRSAVAGDRPLAPVENLEGWVVATGHSHPEFAHRVVLVYHPPSPDRLGTPARRLWLAALGLIWCLGAWLVTERMLFGRGLGLSVRVTLLGSFILVALLPVIAGAGAGRRLVSDQLRSERMATVQELSQDLDRLDGWSTMVQARLFHGMRNAAKAPAMLRALRGLEQVWAARGWQEGAVDREIAVLLASWVAAVEAHGQGERPARVMLIGPNGLYGQWENDSRGTAPLPKDTIFPAVARDFLQRASPHIRFAPRRSSAANGQEAQEEEEGKITGVVQEKTKQMLLEMTGPLTFSRLAHYPSAVWQIKVDVVSFFITSFPVLWQKALRYGFTVFWSEDFLLDTYLRECFGPTGRWRGFADRGFFAVSTWGSRERMLAGNPSHPPGIGQFPQLVALTQSARALRGPMRRSDEAVGVLYEARPSTRTGRIYLAGWRSIAHLEQEATASWYRFLWALLGLLVIALAVAIGAAGHVLDPLATLLWGIERIKAGDFTARLGLRRSDEFGALGEAFDAMARKLNEMALLGRYVSGAVRQAIEDEGALSLAHRGHATEVTVLFFHLLGFERFEEQESPAEVFRVLNLYLDAVDRAVRRHGGEIDKVIGEKILLLFAHDTLGSGEAAVAAALAVARQVRADLAGRLPLTVVSGLNSGPAVVGIIGARGANVDFTAIGDTVNLASRLATLAATTTGSQLVLSGNSLALAGPGVRAERLPFKRVKGKTQEVEAWLWLEPGASGIPGYGRR